MNVFTVRTEMSPRLKAILGDIPEMTRRALFSVGANALRIEVRRHLRREAARRHFTAARFGATPTGHLVRGASRITSHSTSRGAEVTVPVAGISRAFHDLVIRPVRARALTIPVAAEAYGHRVAELRRMGWNVFRLPRHDVLMGTRDGETKVLYALKKQVTVRQDRTLLPDDATVAGTINTAVAQRIEAILRRV